jgi:hypothetical protein
VVIIKHSTGDTYEGELVREDEHRVWLEVSTGKIFCIWKSDIKEMK